MIDAEQILQEYVVTEKAADISANFNKYTFKVHPDASRAQVKLSIEKTFNVNVTDVNIMVRRPKLKSNRTRNAKPGVKPGFKRAIVSLKQGDTIEVV